MHGLRRAIVNVDVLADHKDTALFRGLRDGDRAVHLLGDHVDAEIGKSVGGFGFLLRLPPAAVPDHGRGDLRVDRLGAEREGVYGTHQLRDLKSALEAKLAAFADMSGRYPGEIHAGVAVGPVGADVLRGLEPAGMQDGDVRMLLADLDGVVEIAVAGGEDDLVAAGNQPLHDAFHLGRFGNELEGGRGHAGHVLFDILAAEIHRRVVAEVGGRADIDKADFVFGFCRRGERRGTEQGECGEAGGKLHGHLLLRCGAHLAPHK